MVVVSKNTMEFASNITRVPFGRTYVLICASDAPSPELSYGQDLKSTSFQGVSKVGVLFIFAANCHLAAVGRPILAATIFIYIYIYIYLCVHKIYVGV